jgi:tetratricopeptide (TPR) repeat protein
MKPAQSMQAMGVNDPVTTQLYALIEEHKKDYSRLDTLQQFMELGMAHKRYDILEEYLASFINMGAKVPALYHLIATVQERQPNLPKAIASIRNCFEANGPKTEQMYEAAGRILCRGDLNDLDLCRKLLEQGFNENQRNAEIVLLLAEVYQMLGRHAELLPLFQQAVQTNPFNHTFHFVLGLVTMITSNLTSGFEPYKHRFLLPSFKENTAFTPWPEWLGEPLAGKKIYIRAEQGVGDIFMWAGLLAWVQQQGADITLSVPARMMPLFVRSFPSIKIVDKHLVLPTEELLADYDYYSPLGNLMQYVLPHYKPAEHGPFLIPDKDAVAKKRAEYLAHNPKAKKVIGLSWHSTAVTGWRRNIPLEAMQPLLHDPEAVYISLQYNQQLDDVDNFNTHSDTKIITDYSFIPVDDIDMWATQHAAMDEVYSIQNSSVHLAGALGIPTTIFLQPYGSFHWGAGRNPNPWYKSVTICQQKVGKKWDAVIKEYARSLKKK